MRLGHLSRSGVVRRPVHLHGQGNRGRAAADVFDQLRRRTARHSATGHGAQVPQGIGDRHHGYRPQASHGPGGRSHTSGKNNNKKN